MVKYQFYSKPSSEKKVFTYLKMGSETFREEKKQLLQYGFEVEGDVILANTKEDAIDKFKSNFSYLAEEYANSHIEGGFATFVLEACRELRTRLSKT